MSRKDLRKALENLHNELKNTDSLDERSKEILLKLKIDIEAILNQSDDKIEVEKTDIPSNLRDSVVNFEATHPKLAESMHIVIHTLSNMGI